MMGAIWGGAAKILVILWVQESSQGLEHHQQNVCQVLPLPKFILLMKEHIELGFIQC